MTKRQDLCLQRRSRPEQSDQRQPDQAANISHQPKASPDSTSLASRIEFSDNDRAGNFGRVQHHVVLVRPLTIRRHVVAGPLPIAGVNKSAGGLRFGRFLNFYAARFAMRSMRRAMSSFVIAPPQSHEKA